MLNSGNDDNVVADILVKGNYLSQFDLARAKSKSEEQDISVIDFLIAEGLLTRDLVGQAIAESFGVPYADLNSQQPSQEQVLKIPEEVARKLHAVLFSEKKGQVVVATDRPKQDAIDDTLAGIFHGTKVVIAYSLAEDINATFIHYRKPLETRFAGIIKSQEHIAPEIIDEIFADALAFRASDIHFEPQEQKIVIRFRIDGVLHEAGSIPKEYYENILNRIKVQARLRIDEHFAAQDGAMRYVASDDTKTDLRVSIVPTLDGEKIAIRLLSGYIQNLSLSDLGINDRDQDLITKIVKRPHGMILTTGPTGSGKTTTLYALLKMINRAELNVTTIENPAEYKIIGINQIQVNLDTDLTFAKGLRAIVRQDPDVILVGEIRDKETAEISVNAALTGHMLLSTFHANDAATAIPRLLYMGIEPFLLASTLKVIVAQRLLRRICERCRYSEAISRDKIAERYPRIAPYLESGMHTFYRGKGCDRCGGTGFRGRTAIIEMISVTKAMHNLILQRVSAHEIMELAQKEGTHSLFEDGLTKVRSGITTIEELLRVATPQSGVAIEPSKDTDTMLKKKSKKV